MNLGHKQLGKAQPVDLQGVIAQRIVPHGKVIILFSVEHLSVNSVKTEQQKFNY